MLRWETKRNTHQVRACRGKASNDQTVKFLYRHDVETPKKYVFEACVVKSARQLGKVAYVFLFPFPSLP